MDKENGERPAPCDREKPAPSPDPANILDAASLFSAYWPRRDGAASGGGGNAAAAHSIFGGIPGGYGQHLSGAYNVMMGGGRGGSSGGYPASHAPPTTSSYGSLGTLSVAASQAASLGINPASAAWWTMASHLAAQDYLARLQASAAATGMSGFGAEGLLPGYPIIPHTQSHLSGSGKQSSSSHSKTPNVSTCPPPPLSSNTGSSVSSGSSTSGSHHHNVNMSSSQQLQHGSGLLSDSSSILGGVRLPPDTEIIKYTSSIIGPKVPGTTNRGRKKTISLDPPSVSVMPTLSSTGLHIDRVRKSKQHHSQPHPEPQQQQQLQQQQLQQQHPLPTSVAEYRENPDRVEVIKLPPNISNGRVTPQSTVTTNAGYATPPEADAPLNLSLKSSPPPPSNNNALQSLSSLSQSLGVHADRISRRKPGPKPRKVTPSPLPPPGASPSPSLVQLFAAADSPRPSSGSEENDSSTHHKDGRPRNLGRGISKPKKNTVASLLAQSRALGLKPGVDVSSPLNHVSLLRSSIMQQQAPPSEKEITKEREGEEKGRHHTQSTSSEEAENSKQKQYLQPGFRSLDELKTLTGENFSEESSIPDVSSDSNMDSESDTDTELGEGRKREGDAISDDSGGKRQKRVADESELRIPLEHGWKRETVIRGLSRMGIIRGDVSYISPCGERFKHFSDILRYLERNNITEFSNSNFSFSSRFLVGDYLQPAFGSEENIRLSEQDIGRRLEELKALTSQSHSIEQQLNQKCTQNIEKLTQALKAAKEESSKHKEPTVSHEPRQQQMSPPIDKERYSQILKEAKKFAKEEAARNKEQARLIKEQEKSDRQEAVRKEKEQRNVQLLEGRKRLAFTCEQKWQIIREIEAGKSKSDVSRALGLATSTVATIWKNRSCVTPSPGANNPARRKRQEQLEKQRHGEQQRKQQEREMKRQQAVLLKEQLYMQELNKQRELLYTVELERERRRQHMALVKALDMRKRMEDREKKRLEAKAEKMASRERRMEQRRIEVELLKELRKPAEDMELTDSTPMPVLNRIPGLRLSGQAFADTLMLFEFLHNFGETLGFDMESLPTLNSLQNALLGEEEAEEELLSVMTHLIICAIEDPGIPNPARHTTLLGQSLKQADITHANLSEILRIYLYANATGEVKALTGVHFERDREKRMSDHHNNMSDSANEDWESGKNAAFFVALRENQTWKMSEWLRRKPFLALNATCKAAILAFLCHELLQNKAVIRQIDSAIETTSQLRRDRWITESKMRKLKQLYNRRLRQMAVGMMGGKLGLEGVEEENLPKEPDDDDEGEGESGSESEGTQPEEEEDKRLTVEELGRKLERLNRQAEQNLTLLAESGGQLRANCYGQDRYWRRYWCLPKAGGVFVEAMESAEPELYNRPLERASDRKHVHIKEEIPDEYYKPLLSQIDSPQTSFIEEQNSTLFPRLMEDKKEEDVEDNDEKENGQLNGQADDTDCEDRQLKSEISGGEEEEYYKSLTEEEKMSCFKYAPLTTSESGQTVRDDGGVMNGSSAGLTDDQEPEPCWFSILPRDPCDTTSVTSTTSTFRCGIENSEVRIPVFPPPSASPSPSQCDSPSPAPLALTPEENIQLEHCKVHGLPRPATPQPVPQELRNGWWRIKEADQLQAVVNSLHPRGARERELKRTITRPCLEQSWDSTLKMCVRPGHTVATVMTSSTKPHTEGEDQPPPPPDSPNDWNYAVALRVDMSVLEQVEAMEDKVANASMQVKGWKVPAKATTSDTKFHPAFSHPNSSQNPVTVAKNRLISLEAAIERRYLKPPLGISTVDVNLAGCTIEQSESLPKGLVVWREAIAKAQTSAQLSMALYMLEASIAWDKSIMKANCQFCHSGDNEDKLLLCDGCDKGYHTYCFKPKMENIPDGDWYCYECMNKATGERNCIVCGKKLGRNLVLCDHCPRAYHTDCLQPSIPKVPRGKWHCPTCQSKLPKKRSNAKRSSSGSNLNSSSPCNSANRAVEEAITFGNETIVSPVPVEDIFPETPPPPAAPPTPSKKEKSGGKKMAKEMAPCRQLLDDLESHDEAWPFLLPVNTKQFPTYKKIIKNPMDFSSIRKRLMDSWYKSREEFCSDVRLIFNNCETFNEDDSPVGKAGHGMRMFFETRWLELINQKPST